MISGVVEIHFIKECEILLERLVENIFGKNNHITEAKNIYYYRQFGFWI